jgi:arylsulfatase A-like enzyme
MISRRRFMETALASVVTSIAVTRHNTAVAANGAQPNIVWIFSDDHAQNAVSAYGSRLASVAPTKNIDRIARNGALFENSFVTNSICGPCRAVILTGLHSHLNGFRKNGDRFDGNQQTFPKLLQASGYQTAVFGKWHLTSDPVGFDAWEVLPGQGHYYNPEFITPKGRITEEGYVTDIVTDKALGWLEQNRDPEKPFMLMVQHKAPHREWEPGPDHLNTFDDVQIPEPDNLFDDYEGRGTAAKAQDMSIEKTMRMAMDLKVWDEVPIEGRALRGWQRTYGRMNDEQRLAWDAAYETKNRKFRESNLTGDNLVRWKYQRYMKDYLRCIQSVDDNVGRVLDYLDENGLTDNTAVFYSADQSFYLGEHGWFDKRFMYEESLRTPLVVQWPGTVQPGTRIKAMVQNLDCAQTFLDIAGAPIPDNMQGRTMVPLMKKEPNAQPRESIYYHYYQGEKSTHKVYKHYGVRTQRYKLIYFYTLDEWEFYDLEKDPTEMKSEYGNPTYASEVKAMKKELARLRKLYNVPKEE